MHVPPIRQPDPLRATPADHQCTPTSASASEASTSVASRALRGATLNDSPHHLRPVVRQRGHQRRNRRVRAEVVLAISRFGQHEPAIADGTW
jgi:hypothetical protein